MSSFLSRMFDFRSKKEKERDYENYVKKIFPYGEAQKDKVSQLLSQLYPKKDITFLRMQYILLKEELLKEEPVDFDTAVKKLVKKRIIKSSSEITTTFHALLLADLKVDESLNYPSVEELKELAKNL